MNKHQRFLYTIVAFVVVLIAYQYSKQQVSHREGAKDSDFTVVNTPASTPLTAAQRSEQKRLQTMFGKYRSDLASAYRKAVSVHGEAYVLVNIIDRKSKVQGESVTRLLVLYKDNADPDDYGLVPVGMEKSPDMRYEGYSGELFWTDKNGDVLVPRLFVDLEDKLVVQEWYAPNKYPEMYLMFVNNMPPCLKIKLR